MKNRIIPTLWKMGQVLILLFFLGGYALADEVVLTNGDRFTGTIVEVGDGVLTLETSYSEPIKIKFPAPAIFFHRDANQIATIEAGCG